MNPLLSPAGTLFLPLSQLNPHCNRLLNSLHDGRTSHVEKILFEQTLWNEVKKIRALNDTSIFLYLIGFYHAILYQVAKLRSSQNDLFQYHVLIRLGDLNRYMERTDIAEYYYCNARNIFPNFGHAYNQLGLLTKPSNCYKCCYFYARAAKSNDKPMNTIADSNLRIAVSKYNCEILNYILNEETACVDETGGKRCNKLPSTAFEWFYVVVVAIYADNIQPITKLFLIYMNDNFSTQKATTTRDSIKTVTVCCDRESYILLATLDIILDWLTLGSQGKVILSSTSSELRQIKSCLQTIIKSCDDERVNQSNNISDATSTTSTSVDMNLSRGSANLSNTNSAVLDSTYTSATDSFSRSSSSAKRSTALPHDYVLRGFSPLSSVHKDLCFKSKILAKGSLEDSSIDGGLISGQFIDTGQLLQLVQRLTAKINLFAPQIRRRQTRNIALESILLNIERSQSNPHSPTNKIIH